MSERHFDIEMSNLKEQLVRMAGFVEKAVDDATSILKNLDPSKVNEVFKIEAQINMLHKKVDEMCVNMLALQQPLASDLRIIISVIKMNTDLERMGDQAVNITKNCEKIVKTTKQKPPLDLSQMVQGVRYMVREAINSFVKSDMKLAQDVLDFDDQIDQKKAETFDEVIAIIKSNPEKLEIGFSTMLIARNLEKIADHATNIAEDVIYALTGKDIRHSPKEGDK